MNSDRIPSTSDAVNSMPARSTPSRGEAGGSAQREFDRRVTRRDRRIRAEHPRLGGLILAITPEPSSTQSWAKGARGEREVGARLDRLSARGCVVLHDRRIPGRRANIDHVVVAPSGVWVIDAKRYTGRITTRDVGGWFTRDVRLYVDGRDHTDLVAGMGPQANVITLALGADAVGVDIIPALCFVDSNLDWFAPRSVSVALSSPGHAPSSKPSAGPARWRTIALTSSGYSSPTDFPPPDHRILPDQSMAPSRR